MSFLHIFRSENIKPNKDEETINVSGEEINVRDVSKYLMELFNSHMKGEKQVCFSDYEIGLFKDLIRTGMFRFEDKEDKKNKNNNFNEEKKRR